jgi:hypothetical protein
MCDAGFGLTELDWEGGKSVLPDWNVLEWKKSVLPDWNGLEWRESFVA